MRRRPVKTLLMQLIEQRHPGQTIERLMLDAFAQHLNERDAADALGITQQAFNQWKFRLGLEEQMQQIGLRSSLPVSLRDRK
jgi:hypothetical protein